MVLDAMYMFPEARERVVAFRYRARRCQFYFCWTNYARHGSSDAGVERLSPEPDLVVMKSNNAEVRRYRSNQHSRGVYRFWTREQYARDLASGQNLWQPAR